MNKKTTTAGPTGARRARSLLAFRHQNPLARVVCVLVAFAIATLLVAGTGTAYADNDGSTGADKSAAKSGGHASSGGSAEEPADTAESPSSVETPAPGEEAAGGKVEKDTAQPEPVDPAVTTTATAAPTGKTDVSSALAKIATINAAPDDPDWIWQGSAPTLEDGEKDATAYGGGSAEDTAPSTWTQADADTPKADLLKYYFNVDNSSGIVVSFGLTRASISGDTAFAAEFNQLANSSDTPPRPVRSPGDVLLKFHVDSGNATLEFVHAFVWKAVGDFAAHAQAFPGFTCEERYNSGFGWCEIPRTGGTFDTRITDDGYTAEAKVNLTDLFPTEGCSAIFHSVNLRGESSAENWKNSLQDYLPLPGAVVPSTCASLVINKFRDGTSTKLSGAHFDVYEGADTTGTLLFDDVYDGKAGVDADSEVGQITLSDLEPGTYTVQETDPPGSDTPDPNDDYFLADPDTITLSVAESSVATFNFHDVKKWQPLDISKTASGTVIATYLWSINKEIAPTSAGPWSSGTTPGAPLVKTVDAGGDIGLYYRVRVSENGVDLTNYVVSGTITVSNPNDEPVSATISESLANCTIDGGAVGGSVTRVVQPDGVTDGTDYSYTCNLGNNLAVVPSVNTASVVWDRSDYPQSTGDIGAPGSYPAAQDTVDDLTFVKTEVNKTVNVEDDHFDFVPDWLITRGQEADGVYESPVYSTNTATQTGTCSAVITNTATATGQLVVIQPPALARVAGPLLAQDSESGQVCVRAVAVSPPKQPHPNVLPNTGGPQAWVFAAGLALVLGGGTLVLADQRRRRRS